VTRPERRARALARGRSGINRPHKLAKKAGISVELARRIIAEEQAGRRAP
jgi:hypothetical protein